MVNSCPRSVPGTAPGRAAVLAVSPTLSPHKGHCAWLSTGYEPRNGPSAALRGSAASGGGLTPNPTLDLLSQWDEAENGEGESEKTPVLR